MISFGRILSNFCYLFGFYLLFFMQTNEAQQCWSVFSPRRAFYSFHATTKKALQQKRNIHLNVCNPSEMYKQIIKGLCFNINVFKVHTMLIRKIFSLLFKRHWWRQLMQHISSGHYGLQTSMQSYKVSNVLWVQFLWINSFVNVFWMTNHYFTNKTQVFVIMLQKMLHFACKSLMYSTVLFTMQ